MSKKILMFIILIGILAAGVILLFAFKEPSPSEKTLYILWAVHVEGDTQECQTDQPCCRVGFYQERAFELIDVQGLENLQRLSENHIDSFGGGPKMYISPAGEFFETEMDSQYGGKAFRKYDWLALGHEIGPQPHKIYWSGQKFCWATREMSKEGVTKKLTILHQWAEKWYHNGQKVNHGLTYAPGMKLELPIFGKDLAALAKAEKFIDKEAYKIGYRISMEDWDAYVEDNPTLGKRIPYLYQANYDDGTTMYKIGFQGAVTSFCPNPPRCESPQNAKVWIDNLIKKMKADPDSTHLYYYAFATHPYNPPPPANYLQGEEIQGTIQVFEYLDELVKSGVKIKYITPKDFVALLKEPPTSKPLTVTPLVSQDSPFGIHDPWVPEVDSIEDVAAIGAKWVRYAGLNGIVWDFIEPKKGRFNWRHHDRLYLETYKNGIKMFVSTISASKVYKVEHGYIPSDMKSYLNFLKNAVERYDGDSIDDATGSPVVEVWQIENEPDIFWKDSPENYARILKESYRVIKQANPSAKVAIAGVGTPEGFDGIRRNKFYIRILEELNAVKDNPQDRYFDIFDFHWYPFTSEYNYLIEPPTPEGNIFYFKEYVSNIKQTLAKYGYADTPICITETAQYSGTPSPPKIFPPEIAKELTIFHGENKQALFLLKQYIYAIANGIQKIFWVTLTEWHNFGNDVNGVFDNVGLVNNPLNDGQFHKKLAYYTYKKMVEILEGSDWKNIQTIKEEQNEAYGIFLYKFIKNGKPIYVGWFDCFDNQKCRRMKIDTRVEIVLDKNNEAVIITKSIPEYESGENISAYSSAFNTEVKTVNNGKVTITLKENPVFVEMENGKRVIEY